MSAQAEHGAKVAAVYKTVMAEVCSSVREAFLDDGADEAALAELKSLWEAKVKASGALEPESAPQPSLHHHVHAGMAGGRGEKREPAYRASHTTHTTPAGAAAAQAVAQAQPSLRAAVAQQQPTYLQQQGPSGPPRPGQVIQLIPGQGGGAILPSGVQLIRLANGTIAQIAAPPGQPIRAPVVSKLHQHQHRPTQLDGASYAATSSSASASSSKTAAAKKAAKKPRPAMEEVEIELVCGDSSTSFKAAVPKGALAQLDGAGGLGSDSEESDGEELLDVEEEEAGPKELEDDGDDDDGAGETGEGGALAEGEEAGEPLNTDDDESDVEENSSALFDCDDTVVCQYDKVTRIKNKWKFVLKDGVINIAGKDYLFNKAHGDAEW